MGRIAAGRKGALMQRVESYGLRGLLGEPRRGADISRRTATMRRPNPLFNDEYEQRGRAGHFEYRADGDVLILTGCVGLQRPLRGLWRAANGVDRDH